MVEHLPAGITILKKSRVVAGFRHSTKAVLGELLRRTISSKVHTNNEEA